MRKLAIAAFILAALSFVFCVYIIVSGFWGHREIRARRYILVDETGHHAADFQIAGEQLQFTLFAGGPVWAHISVDATGTPNMYWTDKDGRYISPSAGNQ